MRAAASREVGLTHISAASASTSRSILDGVSAKRALPAGARSIMRTIVLSDLHLGCGACPGIFAGAQALGALLDALGSGPLRVVLNGDTFDYWAQSNLGDGVESVTRALLADAVNVELFGRLGRVVAAGGALIVRGGEHDHDIAHPAVRAMMLAGLQLLAADATRVTFQRLRAPTILRVGGSRLLVARAGGGHEDARRLAELLLNPLRRQYGVGLADLLRPDYIAAVLAALAVNPTAARMVLRQLADDPEWPRSLGDCQRALRLPDRLAIAGLSGREREIFGLALDPELRLGEARDDYEVLEQARLKLLGFCLERRPRAAADGLRVIVDTEWSALQALARRRHASAALIGHSHAAGWRSEDGLTVADTGTWTWKLEPAAVGAKALPRTLAAWQRATRTGIPRAGAPTICAQFTAALIEPRASTGGAYLALIEWRAGQGLVVLREQALADAR
jgi:hypothetical protein